MRAEKRGGASILAGAAGRCRPARSPFRAPLTIGSVKEHFLLDPDVVFLNHGSFGAAPREVIEYQRSLQDELEREPVQFYLRRVEPLLDDAREALGRFIGARPEDLAFVRNATMGVNAVLRSLTFSPGDELLTTNHEYNASTNALRFVADQSGAKVVVAEVPFPLASPSEVVEAVRKQVTDRTRLLLIDHVTSPTALVFPIKEIIDALAARGIDTLVDGAHAPGMLELDLESLGAAYYTGNCHKWVCAPKGAAFLWVRRDRQPLIRPTSISHGANSPRTDRSRFLVEFDWIGTDDFSAPLSIPKAIETVARLGGGWPAVMRRNRQHALYGRMRLCEVLGIAPPAPDEMIGSIATVPLPPKESAAPWTWPYFDPLQDELFFRHRIEVPLFAWPAPPNRLLRVSAQIYNVARDYDTLAAALREALAVKAGV